MKILVSHPGVQHAHQLAWALEEAGHLQEVWTGVPLHDPREQAARRAGLFRQFWRAVPVPAWKRRDYVAFPIVRRIVGSIASARLRNAVNHRLDHLYDRWVAPGVEAVRPDVVVCYENAALRTFTAAKASGAACILDAASVHHLAARQWGTQDPAWVDRQKEQEIELADAILTCSAFAAETYSAAGVSRDKLFPVPLGTVLPDIRPKTKDSGKECRFVFVGSLMRRKAVDLLLNIFEGLQREGVAATLTLIGGAAERDLALRARTTPGVTCVPFIPQAALFEQIARHDVLLLPSRFDSFGMVVPEAMSVGVPALVSDRVGAKCIIEVHPDAGWVVPCNAIALHDKILELVEHRDRIGAASVAARRAASDFTWEKYRSRVVATVEHIYTQRRGRA